MAIVMVSDAGTDTVEQYDQLIKQLEEAGHGNPRGRLSHTSALKDNGSYFVVDVWESPEAFQRFHGGAHAPDERGGWRGTERSDLAGPQHDQRSLGRGSR